MQKGLEAVTKLETCSPTLVKDLARSVISTLSNNMPEKLGNLSFVGAHMLVGAVTAPRGFDYFAMREELNNLHLSDEQILDECIPLAAEHLGKAWERDACTFAQVSLGASRLYGFCKELDTGWRMGTPSRDDIPVLIATFAPEQHLLGPAVLAQQLRRHGCAPAILSNTTFDELLQKLENSLFSALLLSVGCSVSYKQCRKAITLLRHENSYDIPVILGGAILRNNGPDKADSGADLVTNDLERVMQFVREDARLEHKAETR